MTTLTTRAGKGSTLTYNELDANFSKDAVAKTTTYTVLVSNNNDTIECSGTFTISLSDAATMAAADTGDFEVVIKNSGSGTVTVGRITGTDTIDGVAADITLLAGDGVHLKVNAAGNGYNVQNIKPAYLGVTNGTVAASKAVVVDANKDALGFRKITGSTSVTGYTASFTHTGATGGDAAVFGTSSGNAAVHGVFGYSTGTVARGVTGHATHGTGANYGVYGQSDSTAGYGGYFTSPYIGAYGLGTGTSSIAINAYANSATGSTYGVYSRNDSSSGIAGYFYAAIAGGIPVSLASVDNASGDTNNSLLATKGTSHFVVNTKASVGALNPIVQAGDTLISADKTAIDTGVLVVAPYATDSVGIRIDSTADTVVIHGSTTVATLDSTTATITTANVTSCLATNLQSTDSIGSYALCFLNTVNTAITHGTSYAGSGLRVTGFGASTSNNASWVVGSSITPSGTWKCLGVQGALANTYSAALFVRIS